MPNTMPAATGNATGRAMASAAVARIRKMPSTE
jgi:hypothetical protein